jgi:hypothetical protein
MGHDTRDTGRDQPAFVEEPVRDTERLRRRAVLLREISRARMIVQRGDGVPTVRLMLARRGVHYRH